MIAKSCLPWRRSAQPQHQWPLLLAKSLPIRTRQFHSSTPRRDDDGPPNHYAALELSPNASAAEIKKQFYRLSKSHHPDLHPNDPTAPQRFVELSTAYAVLSSPEKKAQYDRDYFRGAGGTSRQRSGSYSSASATPAGGRPASGLSRRRTQFRGPPPSFYQSGGWGTQGAKRSAAASGPSHTHGRETGPDPGMGPGGSAYDSGGGDDEVPHFDARGHRRTHGGIEARRRGAAAAAARQRMEEMEAERGGTGTFGNFVLIMLVVAGVGLVTTTGMDMARAMNGGFRSGGGGGGNVNSGDTRKGKSGATAAE